MSTVPDAEILSRRAAIRSRLKEFVDADPVGLAAALSDVVISLLRDVFPATLRPEHHAMIKDSYPSATRASIKDRALSEEGVITALAIALQIAHIAVDYTALSHVRPFMDADDRLDDEICRALGDAVGLAMRNAEQDGMSLYGSAAITVLTAVRNVGRQGLGKLQLTRLLLDVLEFAMRGGEARVSQKDAEERTLTLICRQLGISRATGKKYMKAAKQQMAEEAAARAP